MKRLIDILGSTIGLIVLSPLLFLISLIIWINMGMPVLFVQWRPGLHGRPFKLVKFRTMRIQGTGANFTASDAVRLTSLGRLLRSWSLDELPELWNVLRGEMSLVGPRPLLMEYLTRYSPDQARRHEVRPGITGWAQINGRNAISWEERFELDAWYVDHQTIWLDFKILIITAWRVVRRDGISAHNHVSMSPFGGPL